MNKISHNYLGVKISDIRELGVDIIIKYRKGAGSIRTVPIYQTFLEKYFKGKSQELLLTAVKFYISTKDDIQILRIFEYPKKFYRMADFQIKIVKKDENEVRKLFFVKIKNKITGVTLEDWVKPEQVSSHFLLNDLICWEKKGNEVTF